jgi:hypothetical protein
MKKQFTTRDLLLITTICALCLGWFLDHRSRWVDWALFNTRTMRLRDKLKKEAEELKQSIADMERSSRVTKQRMEQLDAEFYKIPDKVAESEKPSSK